MISEAHDVVAILPTETSLMHSLLVNLYQIKHDSIRKKATDNYLNIAKKKWSE